MALFITQSRSKRRSKDEPESPYYQLRENYWDRDAKAQRQRHVAYIGKEPRLTRSKAEQICEDKNITMAELAAVQGLEIVEDEAD